MASHASLMGDSPSNKDGKGSIVDDFMYGSNVATAHIYIRMGRFHGCITHKTVYTLSSGLPGKCSKCLFLPQIMRQGTSN